MFVSPSWRAVEHVSGSREFQTLSPKSLEVVDNLPCPLAVAKDHILDREPLLFDLVPDDKMDVVLPAYGHDVVIRHVSISRDQIDVWGAGVKQFLYNFSPSLPQCSFRRCDDRPCLVSFKEFTTRQDKIDSIFLVNPFKRNIHQGQHSCELQFKVLAATLFPALAYEFACKYQCISLRGYTVSLA
jgi:hypothetical protein